MIRIPIPGTEVVSHSHVYPLYPWLKSSITSTSFAAEKGTTARPWVRPTKTSSVLKWTPTATTKKQGTKFIVLYFVIEGFFNCNWNFSFCIRKVFVMLLVVRFLFVLWLLKDCPLNLFVSLKEMWPISHVDIFPQVGWLPRVLKVSSTTILFSLGV